MSFATFELGADFRIACIHSSLAMISDRCDFRSCKGCSRPELCKIVSQQVLGMCRKVKGFHGFWSFFKDADTSPSSSFDCIRAYNRSGESPS